MVKVAGPAMSLEASGSLAKTMTFSKWKGRPYVRSLVKPANPKSNLQVSVRAMMKFLSQYWASIASVDQATWDAAAASKAISPFNAYIARNQFGWRDGLAPSQASPAARVGTPAVIADWSAEAGVRSVTLTYELTDENENWGIAICRSLVTGFTASFANTRFVLPLTDSDSHTYTDAPLEPATYYYNMFLFTDDGRIGAPYGEISAIVE